MEQLMATALGRYKAVKLIQYLTKAYLLQNPKLSPRRLLQLTALVRGCSLQRRLLQLGNAYKPAKQLFLQLLHGKFNLHALAEHVAAFCEDASEDLFTLAQLGWLPKRYKGYAVISDRAWLASLTVIWSHRNIHANNSSS
jgi:hypothetical protein